MMADCGRRRSVADALRREAACRAGGTASEWWRRLHGAVTGADDDHPHPGETLSALADLIEPGPGRTCRMVDNGVELCCSECDRRHSYDDEPEFCMGCGARVVGYMQKHM